MKALLLFMVVLAGCASPPISFPEPAPSSSGGSGSGGDGGGEAQPTSPDPGTGGAPGTTVPSDGGAPPDTGLGACASAGFCAADATQAECDAMGLAYAFEPGGACPSVNLIGCCGDYAQDGGYWACYYTPAADAAALAEQYCTLWQTEAP